MIERPVRIALVGLGAVAEHYYVPALKQLANENLVAVESLFDLSDARIGKFKEMFPNAVCQTVSQITEDKIDLAIIASPVAFHASQSMAAMQNGVSVLCEKPMAVSVTQCKAMVEMAKDKRVTLAIGHVRRHFPALKAIKEILSSGVLGHVRTFKFTEGGPFQWPAASKSFFKKEEAHGGVFLDLGVHVVDAMLWWFGQPDSFQYEDDCMGGLEANCRLDVEFAAGHSGRIQLSRDWWLPNKFEIECAGGQLIWKVGETHAVQVVTKDSGNMHNVTRILAGNNCNNPDMTANHAHCFSEQLRSVVLAIGNGMDCQIVSGEEALKSLQLIESCYGNRKLMSMPWLTKGELSRARQLEQLK